jgi:hypothetical protein
MQKQANWKALANICSGIKPIMVLLSDVITCCQKLSPWQKLLTKPSLRIEQKLIFVGGLTTSATSRKIVTNEKNLSGPAVPRGALAVIYV